MSNFQMAGTEGSFEYVVVANGSEGRIGIRELGGSSRVRIEPKDGASYGVVRNMDERLAEGGFEWKAPNGQFRFSTVVGNDVVKEAVAEGLEVIGEIFEINSAAPAWARQMAGEPAPAVFASPTVPPETGDQCGLNADLVKALLGAVTAITTALNKK